MEKYLILVALAVILRSLNAGKILEIICLRALYPKAKIKEVEKFIKKTKIRFNFPNLWKPK